MLLYCTHNYCFCCCFVVIVVVVVVVAVAVVGGWQGAHGAVPGLLDVRGPQALVFKRWLQEAEQQVR